MYELFLIITFVVILYTEKLKMAQTVNFLILIVIYFANEIQAFTGIEMKVAFAFSMVVTSVILISNVYMSGKE